MQGDGYDRARALLEPFRFGFPRVILGIAVFSAKTLRGVHPKKRIYGAVNDAIMDVVRNTLPRGTVQIESDGCGTGMLVFQKQDFYDRHLYAVRRADLTLFKTAAMYAGAELPLPTAKVFRNDPEGDYDDEWQCEHHLRWYVRIIEDSRLSRELSGEFQGLAQVRVCDDAFSASWSLVNEALGPMAEIEAQTDAKNLGAK